MIMYSLCTESSGHFSYLHVSLCAVTECLSYYYYSHKMCMLYFLCVINIVPAVSRTVTAKIDISK